ncbi:hypothetical protein CWB98_08190 [Pseudoalteromonas rubra]|uniref:Uncharacterized protein n=2 Tax=Pseudoalteromonas rubra TaxID=43658 RepID=A0A5S3X1K1_9GAMM|nr:hypothetical protein CWB98_08190 [Pseudoalteromonas rubra]
MYKKTQWSWIIWMFLTWFATFVALAIFLLGHNALLYGFIGILALIGYLFYGLTLEVDKDKRMVSWWFGPGVLKKSVKVDELQSYCAVTNSFRHGIGVKITHDGWVYAAHGFKAIEFVLADGSKYRIGTNDQSGVLAALEEIEKSAQ